MPSAAAAPSRATNWRSVAWRAGSGMLLMRPMVMQFGSDSWNSTGAFSDRPSAPANTPGLEARSKQIGINVPPRGQPRLIGRQHSVVGSRRVEGLIEVADDVVDVFDADAEADHLGSHPGLALLLQRHLSMGGRGRVAGQGLGVAHVDEPLDEPQRVVELLAGLEPSLDPEGHERAGAAAEVALGERVVGTLREARVVDPVDPAIAVQEFGDAPGIFHVALDPQGDRLDALQQ